MGQAFGSLDNFVSQKCLTLQFLEKSVFEDEIERYEGFLIRKGENICIVYPESDFVVLKTSERVKIKNGNEEETYDLEEFPNPLLKILFYIDDWRDIFIVRKKTNGVFKLIPKDEALKENISHILVKMKGDTPDVIEIYSDPTNYVVFKILKTEKSCKIDNRCNF